MHVKLKKEFERLFDVLITTDPATDKYETVLRSFEMLDSIGPTINDFLRMTDSTPNGDCNEDCADCPNCGEAHEDADVVQFPTPIPEPHPTDPEPEPAPEPKPTLTSSEVRTRLAEARRNGVNVAALIKEFGVDNFTALPATKYADLLSMIDNAGME